MGFNKLTIKLINLRHKNLCDVSVKFPSGGILHQAKLIKNKKIKLFTVEEAKDFANFMKAYYTKKFQCNINIVEVEQQSGS